MRQNHIGVASALAFLTVPLCAAPLALDNDKILLKGKTVEIVAAKRLLFLPFYNATNNKNFTWLETTIGDSLHENAKTKYHYEKIADRVLTRYFAQHTYTPADLYNVEKIARIAKDLAADGVIYGTFKAGPSAPLRDRPSTAQDLPSPSGRGAGGEGRIIVTGKILSVIDREIIAEKTVKMPVSAEMFAAVEEISAALGENIKDLFFPSDKGALVRAAILPGWGHIYKQRQAWGYVWGGLFWSAVGFTALSTAQYLRYTIEYKNFSPEHYTSPNGGTALRDSAAAGSRFDSLVSGIETWGQMTLIGLASVAVVYLGNLLHAYLIRPDVTDNPAFSETHAGVRFNFQLLPPEIDTLRYGFNPITQETRRMRGEFSLVWRF